MSKSIARTVFGKRGRDRLFIMAKVLDVANEGALKSQIMYQANLSFTNLHEYLSLLLDLGLLRVVKDNGKEIYQTTSKGLVYLRSFREIRGLLHKGHTEKIQFDKPSQAIDDWNYCPKIGKLESEIRILVARVNKLEGHIIKAGRCPDCGRGIQSDFRLCPYCGRTLPSSKEEK